MEKVWGSVNRVIYYNDKNGYGVIRITLDPKNPEIKLVMDKLYSSFVTVTGVFERKPIENENYTFLGEFVDTEYGYQFKASSFDRKTENTLEGIINYLSSDLFPGVGKIAATKIFNTLGEESLSLILENKKNLDKVRGINKLQKDTIYENLQKNLSFKETTLAFLSLGLTMSVALKLINHYGPSAYEIIKNDPYILIDQVEGFGFIRADKIAFSLGIKKDALVRVKALLIYILNQYTYGKGNSYVKKSELFNLMHNEIENEDSFFDEELLNNVIKSLVIDNKIVIEEEDIYLKPIFYSEVDFANKIKQIVNYEHQNDFIEADIISELNKLMRKIKITYTSEQKDAIVLSLLNNISIITGGPGTGKSTIINGIIKTYTSLFNKEELVGEAIYLLAPTGRAAKRLQEITKHNAMTVHKFLGYEGNGNYRYGKDTIIACKMVIVDEFSMVDIELASRLLNALSLDVKIVFIGDKDQLPSVGPGNVLDDLISSNIIKTIKLTQIHRQQIDSSIIDFAHSINKGIVPDNVLDMQSDRSFVRMNDNSIIQNLVFTIKRAIDKQMDLIKDIQVLVPMYKGELGIININKVLQEEFNPKKDLEITKFNYSFRVNDKVIQLVNRTEKDVMNGDIGQIISIDYQNNDYLGLTVLYDFGPVYYNEDELDDLSLAYAISIHKAQGSEFDLVVIPFTSKYYIMLKKKLIYTAVTRAKKYLIMLGSLEAMVQGIKKIEVKKRTKLVNRLTNVLQNNDSEIINDEDISPFDFL